MLHFHATQKVLNTSRVDSLLYLSEPTPGQQLHHWYVALCSGGFPGKLLMLYVHDPSLLTIVVKGRTIASTVDAFRVQLKKLLLRHRFPADFIEKEMALTDTYVIGKTNSKILLGHINQMILQVTTFNLRYPSYDAIDTNTHEDLFMRWMYRTKGQPGYQTARKYWDNAFGDPSDDV